MVDCFFLFSIYSQLNEGTLFSVDFFTHQSSGLPYTVNIRIDLTITMFFLLQSENWWYWWLYHFYFPLITIVYYGIRICTIRRNILSFQVCISSLAILIQFLPTASSNSSLHLCFGRPGGLGASIGHHSTIVFAQRSFSMRLTCLAHDHFLMAARSRMSGSRTVLESHSLV